MGLFDDFGGLFADFKDLGDELKGVKDDFILSVVGPTEEFRGAVSDIANEVTGRNTPSSGAPIMSDIRPPTPRATSIPVSDGSDPR